MNTITHQRGPARRRLSLLITAIIAASLLTPYAARAVEVSSPSGSILVVAPHPDDDVITAAGITYNRGDVTIAFLTNGDNAGGSTGTIRQGEAVDAQVDHLGRSESDLIFFGYPDGWLDQVWDQTSGAYPSPSTGLSQTYASRGLGGTDWHDYRMGAGTQHADYNRWSMIDDMKALIDQRRPDHIFVTSHWDNTGDHSTTFDVVDEALSQVVGADSTYGAVVHETIVWHPDSTKWDSWPQNQNAAQDIISDSSIGANPTIETTSGGALVWAEREQFIIPADWQSDTLGSPKALAIAAHDSQGGLGGFIGRFVHRDEIFWAEFVGTMPELSISDATVSEGGDAQFTISRAGARNFAVSVTATTQNGSATAPNDFSFRSDVVTLGVGQAAATFSVTSIQDAATEPTEDFTVVLSDPSTGTSLGDASGTGTITDNDSAGVAVDVIDGLNIAEGGAGDIYRVSLTTQPTSSVTVSVAPDGQLETDRSSVTFSTNNWSTPQSVTVTAVDDAVIESDPHSGTVVHTASSADPAYDQLSPTSIEAAITENTALVGPTTAATGSPLLYTAEPGATTYAWTVTSGGAQIATGTMPTFSFTPAGGGDYIVAVTATVGTTTAAATSRALKVLGDIAGSTFADDIVWMADAGITQGCNPPANDQFCPNKTVTRGQMAAFLVRALGLTDDGGGNTFVDDNGSVFEDDIAKLAAAGITAGCNPPTNDQFCPDKSVTRGQMAAFLRRASALDG